MSNDLEKQQRSNETNTEKRKTFFQPRTWKKLKSVGAHVGLLITLMFYTAFGGWVFRKVEHPAELARIRDARVMLQIQRREFINAITNSSDIRHLEDLVRASLRPYEVAVEEAAHAGLSVKDIPEISDQVKQESLNSEAISTDKWSIVQAVFFASTVITTIGYGNIVPVTFSGRIFCIIFALIGIPLTLTVIADWGKIFANFVSVVGRKLRSKVKIDFGACMPSNTAGKRSLGAVAAVMFLILYLACGALMFMLWEDDWNFFDGFYFCFITMTTIGFGDLVPKKPKYMLLCTLYILIGLALTSTIIELVRMQYEDSWKKLQSLSGPLADTLRRLGESAGGDMSAFQSDLKRVLTVISMPRRKKSGVSGSREGSLAKETEWEQAIQAVLRDIASGSRNQDTDPKLVQIVIYESSV